MLNGPSDVEIEIFDLINDLRAQGFTCPDGTVFAPNPTPQKFDCRLWRSAYLHSEDMGLNSYFSHYSLDGRSPWDRADAQGITANAENLAAGSPVASGTLNQWLASNGHCKNIGSTQNALNAVGMAFVQGSMYWYYWTQQMARSSELPADTSCLSSNTSPPSSEPTEKLVSDSPSPKPTEKLVTNSPSPKPTEKLVTNSPSPKPTEKLVTNSPSPNSSSSKPTSNAPSKQPTIKTTLNSIGGGLEFFSMTGSCSVDGSCVGSGNYPNDYGINEDCTVTMMQDARVTVTSFEIEIGWDKLNIAGSNILYSYAIPGQMKSGEMITWLSDASITKKGWQLCFSEDLKPACVGDHSTWKSSWGGCSTYAASGSNWKWCNSDTGLDGNLAQDVCPECGVCSVGALHEAWVGITPVIGESLENPDSSILIDYSLVDYQGTNIFIAALAIFGFFTVVRMFYVACSKKYGDYIVMETNEQAI